MAEIRKEIEHFCGWGPCDRSVAPPRSQRRTSSNCREDLFDFRAPYDLIKRGKVQTPIEFGHKSSSPKRARLITQYEVLDGNPVDEQTWLHRWNATSKLRPRPQIVRIDRGFFSEKNVTSCKQQGVKVVCIPQRGGSKAPEREAYEKRRSSRTASAFAPASRAHLGVVPRSRHEALSRRRSRAFELWVAALCSQQPHEDCSPVGGPIIAQTKSA